MRRDSAEQIGFKGLSFEALDAASFTLHTSKKPDVLILNPPRRGLGEQLCKWIEKITPAEVVYSSCNAVSLAKDLERLTSYEVVKVQLFDMFAHTEHYEVLVHLKKQ